LPAHGGVDPSRGINLQYFANADGFSRPMWPAITEGLAWTDGVAVVPDSVGQERMIARYAHMKQLGTMLDHGLGVFNHETNAFDKIAELNMSEKWRCPHGHPLRAKTEDGDHLYFSAGYDTLAPFPAVRVRAEFERGDTRHRIRSVHATRRRHSICRLQNAARAKRGWTFAVPMEIRHAANYSSRGSAAVARRHSPSQRSALPTTRR
jgi:hypothetical protein